MGFGSLSDLDAITNKNKKRCLLEKRYGFINLGVNKYIRVNMEEVSEDGCTFSTRMIPPPNIEDMKDFTFSLNTTKKGTRKFLISSYEVVKEWHFEDRIRYEISYKNTISMSDLLFVLHFIDCRENLNRAFFNKK